jgi:hypothetical protein
MNSPLEEGILCWDVGIRFLEQDNDSSDTEDDESSEIHTEDDESSEIHTEDDESSEIHTEDDESSEMSNELYSAVLDGDVEKVKYFVDKGGSVDLGWALPYSGLNGDLEVVKFFVEYCNTNKYIDKALRTSARYNRIEVVEYLIEKGANIDILLIDANKSYYVRNILKIILRKKEIYKGPINDQTETECGICLTEMNSTLQEIIQCKTCKKCIHNECNGKWNGNCVYCRN